MAEGNGQVDAGTAVVEPLLEPVTPTPSTPTMDFSTAIDKEGNFQEGWESLLDEDIRGESYIKETKNLPALTRSLVNARRMVGKDKVALINENSTEGEREEFFMAIGRPSTAEDYNIKRPEEFPEEHWSPDIVTAAQQVFHKLGLSQKQADGVVAFDTATKLAALNAQELQKQHDDEANWDVLQREKGDGFEQFRHLGNIALEKATEEDANLRERLLSKYKNDPDFVRFAGNLGGKFVEHGSIVPDFLPPTPSQIDDEIATLMATDAYKNPGADPKEKAAMVAKVHRLFQKKRGGANTL